MTQSSFDLWTFAPLILFLDNPLWSGKVQESTNKFSLTSDMTRRWLGAYCLRVVGNEKSSCVVRFKSGRVCLVVCVCVCAPLVSRLLPQVLWVRTQQGHVRNLLGRQSRYTSDVLLLMSLTVPWDSSFFFGSCWVCCFLVRFLGLACFFHFLCRAKTVEEGTFHSQHLEAFSHCLNTVPNLLCEKIKLLTGRVRLSLTVWEARDFINSRWASQTLLESLISIGIAQGLFDVGTLASWISPSVMLTRFDHAFGDIPVWTSCGAELDLLLGSSSLSS